MIELSESLKSLYIKTAKKLKGNEKREFMAEVVKGLGIGGQNLAERELGWNRRTIRKGMGELQNGQPLIDGRKRSGRIEKGVDLVVGHRQKKKGLSWSINGSKALSLLKIAELNHCWTSLWFPAQSC